jgi:hypothetical protein
MKAASAVIEQSQRRLAAAGGHHIGDLISWNADRSFRTSLFSLASTGRSAEGACAGCPATLPVSPRDRRQRAENPGHFTEDAGHFMEDAGHFMEDRRQFPEDRGE